MKTSSFTEYFFHYVEWNDITALTNDQILREQTEANYFLGHYNKKEGVFFNPAKTNSSTDTSWTKAAITFAADVVDNTADVHVPGSIGNFVYYPGQEGAYKNTKQVVFDSTIARLFLDEKKKENDAYATLVAAYNTKKNEYNKAVADETARRKDLYSATAAEIMIPQRPCVPTPPYAMTSWDFNLARYLQASGSAFPTTFSDAKNLTYMQNYVDQKAVYHAQNGFRQGFLLVSADKTKTTIYTVSRVLGVLGQGELNTADKSKPFQWRAAKAINAGAGFMISIYPEADTTVGLNDSSKKIELEAKRVAWSDFSEWATPAQPSTPEAPGAGLGAETLAASMLASGLLLASLM